MKAQIWKYEIDVLQPTVIDMPTEAELLSVHKQYEWVALWAKIDPLKAKGGRTEKRTFRAFCTGECLPQDCAMKFIGTVLLQGGSSSPRV